MSYGERSCTHFGRCTFDQARDWWRCVRSCPHYECGDPEQAARDDLTEEDLKQRIEDIFPAHANAILAHPDAVRAIRNYRTEPRRRTRFSPPGR